MVQFTLTLSLAQFLLRLDSFPVCRRDDDDVWLSE